LPRNPLKRLAQLWGVELEGNVIESPTGRVCFGRRGDSCVVVKVLNSDNDEFNSLAALRHFDGNGAVRVVDHAEGAMLLERIVPGTPLTDLVLAGRDDEATAALCDVIAALHRAAPPAQGFPLVEDWGAELALYRTSGDATIPPTLVDRAIGLFAELAASQGPRRLLHGDLHHDNILYDERRGWVAIDPKGVVGEACYEVGSALRNPTSDPARFAVASIIERRIEIVAQRLGFDCGRTLAWACAQAVLSAVWSIADGQDPTRGLASARVMMTML